MRLATGVPIIGQTFQSELVSRPQIHFDIAGRTSDIAPYSGTA
jgi:hypothetical protein